LRKEGTRFIRGGKQALLAACACTILASCATSDTDIPFGFATAGLTPAADATPQPLDTRSTMVAAADGASIETAQTMSSFVVEEGDPVLPQAVIAAPSLRPGAEAGAVPSLADAVVPLQPAPAEVAAAVPAPAPIPVSAQASAPAEAVASIDTAAADEAGAPTQMAALVPQQPKKRSFLSSFFSPAATAAPQQRAARPLIDPAAAAVSAAPAQSPAQPIVQLASNARPATPLVARGGETGASPLPGVRDGATHYEINRRSGLDDDSDIDLHEGEEPAVRVASAAGLARLAPNGLVTQTDHVDVACLKPSLVRVLKAVERNYGRKIIVTSGYRSPDKNRRARGARNSLHMYCAAADVQVEGVSKWELASFVRSMPGRGGVGTYCHTDSVHIDVGPERDWNWRCRRRK
jgi:uncharacterized protein YcbK (DUF882 family)